ncbi:hypothetical protein JQM63_12085 [Oscillibacter valericigenes]|nr:hypothetical protein [Oscillibacter valericigenes]
MPNYQMLYVALFRAAEDAVKQMDAQNYGTARELLIDEVRSGRCACFPNAEKEGLLECFQDPTLLPLEKK